MKLSIKNKDRKQIWMDHLQSWSKGKINQKDYFLKNKLTQSHFSYWKKALNISSIKSRKKLLDVTHLVVSNNSSPKDFDIQIIFPNNTKLQINNGADPMYIEALVNSFAR